MAPAAKRRKTATEPKYHCVVCDTDRIGNSFPDYNPSSECEHLIDTCKTCLKKWVTAQVDESTFTTGGEDGKSFGIKCVQCDAVMKNVNVEIAATKRVYQRFEEVEPKHIGETTPGWRWCMNPECRAGRVHEPEVIKAGPKKAKKRVGFFFSKVEPPSESEPELCECQECGAKACIPCDRPWHEGESCAAYQARIKDRVEEEDRALEAIRKVTKPCPGCKRSIQKNGGCPAMLSSAAGTDSTASATHGRQEYE
ncbi:hypothetical protein LTR29_013385 [Friedmanniomyces endolithicus]|nr:hypothetical protein LTR29_013385 [Friedmanniomyces endolithicus]